MFQCSRAMTIHILCVFASYSFAFAEIPLLTQPQGELTKSIDMGATITLDTLIRFQDAEGNTFSIPAGLYRVSNYEKASLQLFPVLTSDKGPVTIPGTPVDVGHSLSESVTLLLALKENERHLIWLATDGTGVEAVGTVGEVSSRAILEVVAPADRELAVLNAGVLQRAGALSAPVPSSPAEDTVLTGPDVQFAWTAGTATPQAVSYRVCVVEEGQACTSQRAWNSPGVGQPALTATTLRATLPAMLYQGKRLTWSVMVCPTFTASGPSGSRIDPCGYSRPRRLIWTLPAPTLGNPSHRTTLTGPRPSLSIQPVSGADAYLFCVSQPGVACPTTPSQNSQTVVARVGAYYSQWTPGQDLSQFTGQTVHWTAGVCNAFIGCVYQQSVREVTFPPMMVPIFLRLNSQLDVNEVWIVRGGGPGTPRVEEVTVRDLFPWSGQDDLNSRSGGSGLAPYHQAEVRVLVPKRHDPGQEPHIPDYYAVEYMEERLGHAPGTLAYAKRDGTSFAPGVTFGPGYSVVRETIFLFGSSSYPSSRHELVLRGTDNQLYVYRPYCGGLQAGVAPDQLRDGCDGPVRLDTMVSRGYHVYSPAQLGR